jgi:hypothetical protein
MPAPRPSQPLLRTALRTALPALAGLALPAAAQEAGALGTAAPVAAAAVVQQAAPGRAAPPGNVLSLVPRAAVSRAGVEDVRLGLELEHVLSSNLSLLVSPDYQLVSLVRQGAGAREVFDQLLALKAGVRFFLLGRAPTGLWFAPEMGATLGAFLTGQQRTGLTALPTGAATLGGTWMVGDWLSMSLGAGVQISRLPELTLTPDARASVGLAF